MWILHSLENYEGRQLLLTEGFWSIHSLGNFGDDEGHSITKIPGKKNIIKFLEIWPQNKYV